jgi:hypothetical protein
MFDIAHGTTNDTETNRVFYLLQFLEACNCDLVIPLPDTYLKFDTYSTNSLNMFLFILCHAFMLQSNITQFNN